MIVQSRTFKIPGKFTINLTPKDPSETFDVMFDIPNEKIFYYNNEKQTQIFYVTTGDSIVIDLLRGNIDIFAAFDPIP